MARQRNFASEYARRNVLAQQRGFKNYREERISKGIARGLTQSQAAGTPKVTELPASIANTRDTKRNWIATAIKEIKSDVDLYNQNGILEKEQLDDYREIVKTYQEWRRGGWKDDTLRHRLNNLIRDYKEVYDDSLDYKGGEGDS